VSGNNTINDYGAYGTNGVLSLSNYPGSRESPSMASHSSLNCLFVFGGWGYATSSTGGMFVIVNLESSLKEN
jgi:hypothetical protein